MKIVNWKNADITETPHKLDVRRLYDYDNAQAVHISLKPGEGLKPHITPVNVFFYILEGAVDVQVGDETITVERDHLVESPKDIVHCLSNSSAEVSRILVAKSPKPTAQTKLL